MLKNFLIRLIGKRLDAKMEAWHISKTKLAANLAVFLPLVQTGSTYLGHPVVIPSAVYEILAGFGLWALRDGSNSDALIASAASLNKELEAVVKP